MPHKPLTVELSVCPVEGCRHVGKLPAHITRKDYCNGGTQARHKPTKMERRAFVEVLEDKVA